MSRHGHVLRSSCSFVKRQRNWAPFQTAVGHWSAHGPFILNVSLSHHGFALLHLHGSTVTDFLHKEFLFASNSWKLRASRILTVFISTADNASLTLLVKEDSSRANPFLGLWIQLLPTFAWCSCACQRLLRFCTWSRFHNVSQSVPSIEGSVHDTHHILVLNREFLRIRGTPLHCEGTAQSDQSGSQALLLIKTAFHTISCSRNSLHCTSTSCLHFQPDEESCAACL